MPTEPNRAVFLSYASQDAEAARRICETLRASGVEVWFDADGGLEHGDEWDAKIRRQIKECVLFIPVISANTQAREEGYFRLEWDLAAERARTIASGVPFILPVVIDDTREPDALVPDRFRAVQWTRLRGGEVPPDVQQRFLKLWSHRTGVLKHEAQEGARAFQPGGSDDTGLKARATGRRVPAAAWIAAAALALLAGGYFFAKRPAESAPTAAQPEGAATRPPTTVSPAAPQNEAQKLVAQARQIYESGDELDRENLFFADELVKRAIALDSTEASAWELGAALSYTMVWHSIDTSVARQDLLLRQAARARALAPQSASARLAMAMARLGVIFTNAPLAQGTELAEIERELRDLAEREPRNWRVQRALGTVYRFLDRTEDSIRAHRLEVELAEGNPIASADLVNVLVRRNRFGEAEEIVGPALARRATARLLTFDLLLKVRWRGDLEGARAALATWPGWLLQEDRGAFYAWQAQFFSRAPQTALAAAQRVPRDYLRDHIFSGPRAVLTARAHELAGNTEAAQADWRTAVQLANRELATSPDDSGALYWKAWALARLGDATGAGAVSALLQQRRNTAQASFFGATSMAPLWVTLGRTDLALTELRQKLSVSADSLSVTRAMLELDPAFDGVRDDPKFREVVALVSTPPPTKPTAEEATNAATAPDPKSVAVLAFANLSNDPENEYFSDGIADELLTVLQKIPGLRVAARTSAFSFKGKNATAKEVGEKLGMAHVVEGSVQKSGQRVKITARLSRAATNEEIWSESYGPLQSSDVFVTQSELAQKIVAKLRGQLTGETTATVMADAEIKAQVQAATKGGTNNPEAYNLLLQGRYFSRRENNSGWNQSLDYFRSAIGLDRAYSLAWAEMAQAYIKLGRFGGMPTAVGIGEARRAAQRALELDPDQPIALSAMGWVQRTVDFDWKGAEKSFQRALALAPEDSQLMCDAAVLYFNIGQVERALALAQKAAELDSLSATAQLILGDLLWQTGRVAEGVRQLPKGIKLAPDAEEFRSHLAVGLAMLKRFAEAEAMADQEPNDGYRLFGRAYIASLRGDRTAAAKATEGLVAKHAQTMTGYIAMIYAVQGNQDEAFVWLERAYLQRDSAISWAKTVPHFQNLAADPRWPAFLRKIGLHDDQLK